MRWTSATCWRSPGRASGCSAFSATRRSRAGSTRRRPGSNPARSIRPALGADAALALMLAEPLLIRRPLIEAEGRRCAGFDKEPVLSLLGQSEISEAAQGCSRPAGPPCPAPKDSGDKTDSAEKTHARIERRSITSGPSIASPAMPRGRTRSTGICSPIRFAPSTAPRARSWRSRRSAYRPPPLTLEAVGALLHLSMGLSAWKQFGPDRWALRCNPSSGNLHPTEAYVLAEGLEGLDDGLHHYLARDHALEQRRRDDAPGSQAGSRVSGSGCPRSTGAKRGNMASAPFAIASSTSAMPLARFPMPPPRWAGARNGSRDSTARTSPPCSASTGTQISAAPNAKTPTPCCRFSRLRRRRRDGARAESGRLDRCGQSPRPPSDVSLAGDRRGRRSHARRIGARVRPDQGRRRRLPRAPPTPISFCSGAAPSISTRDTSCRRRIFSPSSAA